MNKIIIKKILCVLLLMLILFSNSFTLISSAYISSAHLQEVGDAPHHLKYDFGNRTSYVVCSVVGYHLNGQFYPAYCLNRNLQGAETAPYDVVVNQVMDNNAVWRVLVNGYPYQSASAMGLSDFDAFCVTKMAVYCVLGQSDVNRFVADSSDGTAVHMLNKLRELVNIGLNGGETMQTETLASSPIGEFTQAGNYYYQEYAVDSRVEIAGYNISNFTGFAEGSYIANTNGDAQNSFGNGEHFRVYIPKAGLGSDVNGNIEINAKAKIYPILYGQSNNPNLQDYVLTTDIYGDENTSVSLNIATNTGKITVNKIDDYTKKPISGVTFGLYKRDGTEVARATTDAEGKIIFSSLYQDNYILKELSTNDNYILNTAEFEVNVEFNGTSNISVENEHKKGNLKVYKVDSNNKKIALGGVKFSLYSYEFDQITGHYVTDVNGEIYIENLRIGNWALIEEETNKWYNLTDSVDIKVEWNETTNTTIENELKKSQIKVIKVDEEDHEVKLKDVVFEVLDEKKNVLETITTNEKGEAVTSQYPVRDYPYLYIQETKTNEKYVLDDTIHKIELKENEIVNQTFENRKIKGQIKVIKTAEEDNKITGDKKGDPISDVSFGIYDENKNYIETITTGEDGTAISSLLEKGIKYVKELESGEWYLLNEEEYSAEIVNDGDIIEVNITNIPEKPEVDIEKDGIIQTTANQEIKYDFKIKNTGNTKLDNFIWTDTLPTDYVTATKLITGTYNQDLNYSLYYKTNKNNYRLLKENLNTQVNNFVDFIGIELDADEYITDFKVDFGTVDVGFESIEKPQLFVNVKSTVKNDDVFTNKTRIEGYNKSYLVWDEDDHTTKVYEKKINVKLPRTGC